MSSPNLKEIGKRIQKHRLLNGYTQEQLADMMGVSVQMVSNLERGIKAIRIGNLINLSEILGISTDYILTGQKTPNDTTALDKQLDSLSPENEKLIKYLIGYFSKHDD